MDAASAIADVTAGADALRWVETPGDGDRVVARDVPAVVSGVVVLRAARAAAAEGDDRAAAATCFRRPTRRSQYVAWTTRPRLDDRVLAPLRARRRGCIVARSYGAGLRVCVRDVGVIADSAQRDALLRACYAAHPRLVAAYRLEEGELPACDGSAFGSWAECLAHAIEHHGVDVLEELRQRPQRHFAEACARHVDASSSSSSSERASHADHAQRTAARMAK